MNTERAKLIELMESELRMTCGIQEAQEDCLVSLRAREEGNPGGMADNEDLKAMLVMRAKQAALTAANKAEGVEVTEVTTEMMLQAFGGLAGGLE